MVKKLEAAGAVILGKTNLDEFAMGSSTENSAFRTTRNPWDTTRVPGGSSGGSAAALAAGLCCASLGSDTGGSIRQPAALCGLVGLKPTYGRVSRYGLVAFASSLDQIGPFGWTVRDVAELMNVISGPDPKDSTCVPEAVPDYTADLDQPLKGLRLGIAKEFQLTQGMDPAVSAAVDAAIALYKQMGAELVDVSLPHTEYGIAAYYVIAPCECSSNLARYDGVHFGHRTKEPVKDIVELFSKQPGGGVRRRGPTPDHDRHVRALQRLLRRLLQPGVADEDADQAGLRRGVPAVRRHHLPDQPDAGVQGRREDRRPAADVPVRRVHGDVQTSPASRG